MSRITMSAPRPSSLLPPAVSVPACDVLRSSVMCVPPTYPTMRPTFAFAALPTPDVLRLDWIGLDRS
jgi:hypothetical protein